MVTLHAAGFNGHGQLSHSSGTGMPQDRPRFEMIASAGSIEVLRAGWQYTILKQDNTVRLMGFLNGKSCQDVTVPLGFAIQDTLICESPRHVGFTSSDGKLYLLQDEGGSGQEPLLVQQGDDDSPKISFVAVTATGHTCVSFLQPPASHLTHLLQFKTFSDFLTWFSDPGSSRRGENYTHHSLRGRAAQLGAGAAHFILRTESGDLYSWTTDARHHRCLGRAASLETPATAPAPIEALGGINIIKLATGSWMTLALSKDRDAYVWGKERPQERQEQIRILPSPAEDVRLVDIAEGVDVIDVTAGSGHLLVLTAEGRVMGAGDNLNGQLSILQEGSQNIGHASDWEEVRVTAEGKVKRIWAGDCTSFALLASP